MKKRRIKRGGGGPGRHRATAEQPTDQRSVTTPLSRIVPSQHSRFSETKLMNQDLLCPRAAHDFGNLALGQRQKIQSGFMAVIRISDSTGLATDTSYKRREICNAHTQRGHVRLELPLYSRGIVS
ncbi:uncharacterized protein [Temnothorax nylanderi]|uniref:uncharacterized protein n=1 Tax=Temnothorax nylanderi TaxID=102681 RepID=UPI003A894759